MGNYKFRLADMVPNAWFYKLRDMSKKSSNKPKPQKLQPPDQIKTNKKMKKKKKNSTFPNNSSSSSPTTTTKPNPPYQRSPRKSYYFTRDLTSRNSNPNSNSSSPPEENPEPRAHCKNIRTRKSRSSAWESPSPEYSSEEEYSGGRESRSDRILATTQTGVAVTDRGVGGVCPCQERENGEENDVAAREFDSLAKLELPPIATKPKQKKKKEKIPVDNPNSIRNNKNNNNGSPGIRLRINNSPRIASRRVSGPRKSVSSSSKSLSSSFAVVKSSFDPQRDFRESMVEMIVENNIRASKDLEDLLACYLSLNSDEYHGLIIKVFKQIWFDLTDISN